MYLLCCLRDTAWCNFPELCPRLTGTSSKLSTLVPLGAVQGHAAKQFRFSSDQSH